jgi:lysophospholipid acyltransferase (LPLAT)-like uncharacterized protein
VKAFLRRVTEATAPGLGAGLLKALRPTWRFRESGAENKTPFNNPNQNYIYAFWHGHLLPACAWYRHPDIRVMVSRNRDGELISRTMLKLGYPEPVRGSSSRGGSTALKQLARLVQEGQWAVIFPDGPRGPGREAQTGVLTLAKLTGRAVVPVGFAAKPAIRLRSWDRFIIPLPFAKGLFCFGEPMKVPEDAGSDEVERLRLKLQDDMNEMGDKAQEEL